MTMRHHYKVWPRFYDALASGVKPFDVRKIDPDRHSLVSGDTVAFVEVTAAGEATGRSTVKRVTYVMRGDGVVLPVGWMVMGLAPKEPSE